MLKLILDTNIILSSISRKSPYHSLLEDLFNNVYELYVTTEILLEYEEKLTQNFSAKVAEHFISALLMKTTVKKINVYFDLNVIELDADDNKFINCAFAGNVNHIVSNDRHFNILKKLDFPKINLLIIDELADFLNEIKTNL